MTLLIIDESARVMADLYCAVRRLYRNHCARGEPVGYVFGVVEAPSLVALTGRVGWVHDLYVAPAARGVGTGGRLLDAAVAALHQIGCPGGVLLGVAAQNSAAAALFRGRGFRLTLQEMTLGRWPADDAGPGRSPDGCPERSRC